MKLSEAISKNTQDLLDHYKKGEISFTEILELEQEAIIDEEYEVAISIKEVLDIIITEKKQNDMLDKILEWFPEEEILVADGFNDAIIGIDEQTMRLIYSVSKCIDILKKDMDEEEAVEYFNYNVKNAYFGEKTPIWCIDDL